MRLTICLLALLVGCATAGIPDPPVPELPVVDRQPGDETLTPRLDPESPTGVYVPADLAEALVEVHRMLPEGLYEQVREMAEDDVVILHFDLGMYLRNAWGLWADSRLARYFQSLGLDHPDDMSGVILDSYWRVLHERPIDLQGQIDRYREYWAEMEMGFAASTSF